MLSFALLASLLSLIDAKPLGVRGAVMHERRDSIPDGFVKVGPAPASQILTFQLGLVQGNIAGLEDRLMAVSSPSNADYGKWLSKEQVESYVAPKQGTLDAINAFLSENNITAIKVTPAGDTLSISLPVSNANRIFNTQFDTFKHTATSTESVRTLEYSIPASLKGHLEYVHPTTVFPQTLSPLPVMTIPLPNNVTAPSPGAVPASCSRSITPACLQALYHIPARPATERSNVLGVTGYLEQYANKADLSTFLERYRPDLPSNTSFALETFDGGQNPQDPEQAGVEANLDIQYTVGVASNVPAVFLSVGSQNHDGLFGFLDLAHALIAQANPPKVLSTSYGTIERGINTVLYTRLCNAYLQLGIRGTTVLYASGDGGVSGFQDQACTQFVPTFPSGCPYLTSVGATQYVTSETAAGLSSGGFSDVFARPPYQDVVVEQYLARLGDTNKGLYNPGGRGFPDVAAVGVRCTIVYKGVSVLVDGTSCSCPIFASVIALLNDELIADGRSPLGFVNPLLYALRERGFNDITAGSNPGCGTDGFPAETGWDPITGLGSPNFEALRTLIGL